MQYSPYDAYLFYKRAIDLGMPLRKAVTSVCKITGYSSTQVLEAVAMYEN